MLLSIIAIIRPIPLSTPVTVIRPVCQTLQYIWFSVPDHIIQRIWAKIVMRPGAEGWSCKSGCSCLLWPFKLYCLVGKTCWCRHCKYNTAVFVSERLLQLLENHTSTALEKLSYVINSFKLLGHRQNRRVPTASFRTANPRYTVHAVMRLCLIRRRILVDIKPRFRVIFLLPQCPLPSRFGWP